MELLIEPMDSPIGTLLVACDGQDLHALDYADGEPRMLALLRRRYPVLRLASGGAPAAIRAGLQAYFAGDVQAITTLPVETGGTAFQQRVWDALRALPAGVPQTYGALAARLARPSASRAVGQANARNPVAIVIPCHRLIGANATLAGYAGGLARKRWLLAHEGVFWPPDAR